MKRIIITFALIFITACSANKEVSQNEEKDIYVFDSQTTTDTIPSIPQQIETDSQTPKVDYNYIVQVGAFTTQERAEQFVKENKSKISYELLISFSNTVNLFVVQLVPVDSRENAESIRNEIWTLPPFKDAFILTIQK
ncbi:MAG: SPOR domain-containing protein [Melioribacteraceae bacterium]|nr:SPOR domain-containing protein [Melioribacteraceae bacterium]